MHLFCTQAAKIERRTLALKPKYVLLDQFEFNVWVSLLIFF